MKIIKSYFRKIYIRSAPEKYDREHLGTFSFFRLFFINLFSPGRTINRLRYNQIWKNEKKIIKKFEKNLQHGGKENFSISDSDKTKLSNALSDLISNGVVVIDSYFSDKKIKDFIDENNSIFEELRKFKSKETTYSKNILTLTNSLMPLWLDDNLLNLISFYIGRQFYARDYPAIVRTYVPDIYNYDTEDAKAANKWHVDHSVFFSLHILLEDTSEKDTGMVVLPGTQKLLNYPSLYTDEVVKDLNIKPKKCFGKKGTVYIHSGNVVHRLKPERASHRLELKFDFTAGSNISLNCERISKCLKSNFNLENLDLNKREILKGIFPKTLYKGYEFEKEAMIPSKYQGI